MVTLGATVRSLRTRVGLSQEELAQLVGLSQAQISRLERGRWELAGPEFLVRLASVLGVSKSTLHLAATPWQAAPPGHPPRVCKMRLHQTIRTVVGRPTPRPLAGDCSLEP
jgi:transcriptional regulator with XRE-family HTH domain